MKVPLETNSHCITCPTITERISERSNFDLLIDAESLPNENPLNDNLDSDTGFSKFHSRALTVTVQASCKIYPFGATAPAHAVTVKKQTKSLKLKN